jgi:hypothetical protein
MSSSFKIHHPMSYDSGKPWTKIGGSIVLAWGTTSAEISANDVSGMLFTKDHKKVYIGWTLKKEKPYELWCIVFDRVSEDDYILELRNAKDGSRIGDPLEKIKVTKDDGRPIGIATPASNSMVGLAFMAGGQDTDYKAVTTTFSNGGMSFPGQSHHTGTPLQPYWIHGFSLPASAKLNKFTLDVTNGTANAQTMNINVI